MDCGLSGSSVCWILQARILEWVAIPFSSKSFWPMPFPSPANLSDPGLKYHFIYFHLISLLSYHIRGQLFPFLPQINLPTCVIGSISFLWKDLSHMITTHQHLLFISVLRLEVCGFLLLHFANSSAHRDLVGHLKEGRTRWGLIHPKAYASARRSSYHLVQLTTAMWKHMLWLFKSRQESRFPYAIW